MKRDATTKVLLAVIAILLAVIVAQRFSMPEPARAAATADATALWIEPGTTNLRSPDGSRNVIGKVVVDLNNGNVWGFPTLTNAPYPMDTTKTSPPVSYPIFLGKYEFDRIHRGSEQPAKGSFSRARGLRRGGRDAALRVQNTHRRGRLCHTSNG